MSNSESTLLASMQKVTVTQGWDVLVAYNATSINDLFAAQFVTNARKQQNFLPINDTMTVAGTDTTVQFVNLTLGPPLISFSPDLDAQDALVTMDFVAGQVIVEVTVGKTSNVSAIQDISPGDGYQLSMIVPLAKVTGSIDKSNSVVVQLTNASNYTANLLPGTAAGQLLGSYFKALFQAETQATLTYDLGSISWNKSNNLLPVSFDICTQPYPAAGSTDGAVVLLVATTYTPGGGVSTEVPATPYLIPDGNTCSLIVSNNVVMSHIILPQMTSQLASFGAPSFVVQTFSGTTPATYIQGSSGNIDAGVAKGSWTTTYGRANVWSGKVSWLTPSYSHVMLPVTSWTVKPGNDLLTTNWSENFTQSFGSSQPYPHTEGYWSTGSVTLSLSLGYTQQPEVSNQAVSFNLIGTASPNLHFQSSSWMSKWFGNGGVRDNVASAIASQVQTSLSKLSPISIPGIDTFAISNLLFPQENALQYSQAHLPGDLVIFGQIQPNATAFALSPVQAVLGPGDTQAFQAAGASGTLTWTIYPAVGTVASGTYTAPSPVTTTRTVAITAKNAAGALASAVVTLVQSGVVVSPSFGTVSTAGCTVALQATVLGGTATPTWSISPSDGSAGTVSSSGVYTAPATMPTSLTTATVTATVGSSSATSLICLNYVSLSIGITPTSATLTPNGTQQFTADIPGCTWSVSPAVGTVSSSGLYTAPASVTAPATVVVSAYDDLGDGLYGYAVVTLGSAQA